MAVQVFVVSSKFYDENTNGVNFDQNLTDFTFNLVGNVMEEHKLTQQIDVSWNILCSSTFKCEIEKITSQLYKIKYGGGNWIDEGFSVGDILTWKHYEGATPSEYIIDEAVINSIDGQYIFLALPAIYNFTDGEFSLDQFHGTTQLTALIYKFNLIENDEAFNVVSKVSGHDQAYYASGIGLGSPRATTTKIMSSVSVYNDWITGTSTVKYVSDPSLFSQRFEINHRFKINPWYLEGELSNLENSVAPDIFAGLSALKYAFNTEFRSVLSSPQSGKIATVENNPGSTGWYNENFNGFDNEYAIESIAYESAASGDPSDGLLIGEKTKVTIVVTKSGGFAIGQKAGLYLSYLPLQSEYQDTIAATMSDNYKFERLYAEQGGGVITAFNIIKSLAVSLITGNKLEIIAEIEYSTSQQVGLTGEKYYILGVNVADSSLTAAASDRVQLLIPPTKYDESADISGLMSFNKLVLLQHPQVLGLNLGYTDITGWPEDGILADFDFSLDLNKDAFINSFEFKLIAYKDEDEYFELNTYTVPITGAIVSGGVQQLNIDETRGYILAALDQFDFVKMIVGTNVAGIQHYTGQIGQKISWQDWIANLEADTVFYDATKSNDNLNRKSSNYSNLEGYQIKLAIKANVSGTSNLGISGNTDYLFLSSDLTIYDYDFPTTWSAVVETFRASNSENLNGAILTGEDTIFSVTWTRAAGPVTDISDFWAIHRIEETGQNGYEIDELSTIRAYPDANRIVPIIGQTQLSMAIIAGKVVTLCLIDGNKIQNGVSYNLSGRISNGIPLPVSVDCKLLEDGTPKFMEDGTTKILDA